MPEKARVDAKINETVKKQAQIKALQEGLTLSEVIELFLATWVFDDTPLPQAKNLDELGKDRPANPVGVQYELAA